MKLLALFAAMLFGGTLLTAQAQETPLFPFAIPWDDSGPAVTDVSALNPTPAGNGGFITPRNGHFYDEKGRRVRFLGVNFTFSADFPDKADAEKVAARLHKYGVNIVRLHHMDMQYAPNGIWDPAFKDKQHLDKDQLDRLDNLVYQLKQHGIYVNINLHVSRSFTEADGLPETDKLPEMSKIVSFFDPRMIELQKSYAHDLLTHLNPYTGTRYVEEPAVAVIEINNEDTLLGAAWDGSLTTLPPHYKAELTGLWNDWLKQKYKSTVGLKRAWSAGDKPFGPNLLANADFTRGAEHWNLELNQAPASARMQLPDDLALPSGVAGKALRVAIETLGTQNWHIQLHQAGLDLTEGEPYTVTFWAKADHARPLSVYAAIDQDDWHHIGLDKPVQLTPEWQKFNLAFQAARTLKDHDRLSFVLGDALGTVDLAGITLKPGAETEFPAGLSVEKGSVPLGQPTVNQAGQDWIAFLMDTEQSYIQGMRNYIKKELNARANVVGSQASYGGLGGALRESHSDFTDMHAYWDHPQFPHKPWDAVDWHINNTSMVRSTDGGTLPELARYRIAGKPFTVSEYSHPAPSDYQAECVPMLAAFAAVQDWDGIYLFDYASDRNTLHEEKLKDYFSIDGNPAKLALLPAAAMLFLRDDMPLAYNELRLRIPTDEVVSLLAKDGADVGPVWEEAGIHRLDALSKRFSLSFAENSKPELSVPGALNENDIINKPSGKGPLDWQTAGTDSPIFTADSPSSKLMVGFLGGQSAHLPGWLVQMTETPHNFAAMTLTAMDGRPMEQSHSLLLTAVGEVENTGMRWNADRTSVGDHWGTAPAQVEGIPASVTIATVMTIATVYALDSAGKRAGTVDSKLYGGTLTFTIGPANKTLWYEIEANVKR
jgi:hypothetical protein